ncbi:MAG: ribosome-associated translation inhibitor RaiA [Rhizobiaceae bacterium]
MTLRISGKHMDIGDSLKGRIEGRIADAVDKYFGHGYSGHVNMEKQGAFFSTDCMLHLDSGIMLQASAREADAHASFDKAAERIEKRLRRYKRKLKGHKNGNSGQEHAAAYAVMSTPAEDEELEEDFAPLVVAESSMTVRTQTVAMAVMQLELMDQPVNVFKNAANGAVNVVYRRTDGNIGWVDPSSTPSS